MGRPKDHCQNGLDDRCRDEDGQIRRKRDDTLVRTLRRSYGPDFAAGAPGDMTLGDILDITGAPSLTQFRKRFGS